MDDRSEDRDGNGDESGTTTTTTGTYLVTHADAESAVLRDVHTGRVHTLAEPPEPTVEAGDVLEATLAPDSPAELVWRAVAVEDRRRIAIGRSPEPPTRQARKLAAATDPGEVTVRERAGEGELHVLRVSEGLADDAASDVLEDDSTLARAARMPAITRVEVRAAEDVVSVRYLP